MPGTIKVASYVFFRGGGIGRYTVEVLRRLGKSSLLEMELLCSPEFEWKKIEEVQVKPVMMALAHKIPLLRRAQFLMAQWVNPRRLLRKVIKEDIHVVHFSSYNSLTFPFWKNSLRKTGVKVVVSAHDILRSKPLLCRTWEDRQLAAFYRYADAILVHSEFQVRQLEEFALVPRDKVHIVPHGPYDYPDTGKSNEELRNKYGVPTNACLGLFFGQLRDEKNLEGLLRAMPGQKDGVHLLVAGKGNGRHKSTGYYQTLAVKLGVSDRVTFIDRFIGDDEVGGLFRMSNWLALPYDETFVSQSGVLNIAGRFELPILVGDAPVLRETVVEMNIGIAAPQGDFAGGVSQMVTALEQGRAFEFQTYRSTQCWEENARITEEVYRSLIDQSNGAGMLET